MGVVNFVRRCASFVVAGVADRVVYRFTGKQVSFGKAVAAKLSKCEPWSDHFEESCLRNVKTAIRSQDFRAARLLLTLGKTEEASYYCVDLAMKVIDFLASGEEVEYSLFTVFDA